MLQNKIDFVVLISVNRANPNGDPLNGNRPREDINGFGEISDVALKRKIRNRWIDMGEGVFVQSDDKRIDDFSSLSERAEKMIPTTEDKDAYAKKACEQWLDVRGFGQLFAFKKRGSVGEVSIGIRGPISIHPAFSVDTIDIEDIQITKSVNSEPTNGKKSSDTMGMKHRVNFGLYLTKGSINCQLAEKTGFSSEDAEKLHSALITMFENDASAARPEGSIIVEKVYWFKHSNQSGQYPSFQVHQSIQVKKREDVLIPHTFEDYEIIQTPLEGLTPEIFAMR